MFKKFISYLLIFSILISDLTGWGSRSVYAMMESDEHGEHHLPIQARDLSERPPSQGESLDDKAEAKPTLNAGQGAPTAKVIVGDQEQKNLPVLDVGKGIVPSNEEGLNLSPREGKEEILPEGNVSFIISSDGLNEDIVVSQESKEKIPLLQNQRNEKRPQEKKTGLTQDWELVDPGSDDPLTFKQKSDGIHTDCSDAEPFKDDIKVTRSGDRDSLDQRFKQPFPLKEGKSLLSSKLKPPSSKSTEPVQGFSGKKAAKVSRSYTAEDDNHAENEDSEVSSDEDTIPSHGANSPLQQSMQSWTEMGPLEKQLLEGQKATSSLKRFSQHLLYSEKQRTSFPERNLSIHSTTTASELEDLAEYEGFHIVPFHQTSSLSTAENFIISLDQLRHLSPEMEDFLLHVKVRIIEGKLNWKQIFGIGGGIVVGAGVSWPWMCIMFNNFLNIYTHNVLVDYSLYANKTVVLHVLDPQFQNFNSYLNFKTMIGLVGIPMGIRVASRTASILIDFTKDSIHTFSIQKTTKHSLAHMMAKGSAYVGAGFAGLLPAYYLFHSLLGCNLSTLFNSPYGSYAYYISADIFLNILTNTTNYGNIEIRCTFQPLSKENFQLFGIGGSFLFFSTFLHYGHQVSNSLKKWINDSFFVNKEHISPLTLEAVCQDYLAQFKGLIQIIEERDVKELHSLYDTIFRSNIRKIEQNAGIHSEELSGVESLRVLKIFQDFHHQHKDSLTEDDSNEWKKSLASRIGRAIPLMATFGRMVIFQYIIAEFLGSFWGEGNVIDQMSSIDFIDPSVGAITLSCILGYTLGHLAKGIVEKEAVEESIYELLGGKKFTNGNSHSPLRIGLKIWDYLCGTFQTLPYLVIGFAATTKLDWPNLYQLFDIKYFLGNVPINPGQILFLLTFGIADVFSNAVAFQTSNSTLINAWDSLFSYYYAFEGYKQDKLIRMARQLQNLFKELSPRILEEINQILNADGDKFISGNQSIHKQFLTHDSSQDPNPSLSLKTKEFLCYVKVNVANGTLNWKQRVGIGGGVLSGAAISWPLMTIIFYAFLTPYFQSFEPQHSPIMPVNVHFYNLTTGFTKFNNVINSYTLMSFVGLPLGIDAASRTAIILSNLTAENTSSFSIQKTTPHWLTLLGVKSSLYVGTFFASVLPVYYLYDSLFGSYKDPCGSNHTCSKMEGWFLCPHVFVNNTIYYLCPNGTPYCCANNPNCQLPLYTYTISPDIFFNITGIFNSPNVCRYVPGLSHKALFGIGAPILFFDTFLQYGYRFSLAAEKWVNNYFFDERRDSSRLSLLEATRKKYLTQFRNLKRTIYDLEEDEIKNLYGEIFVTRKNHIDPNAEIDPEKLTINEALHILTVLQNFCSQNQKNLEENEGEDWKKAWASHIGWAIPLIATYGRILIFQYVLVEILGAFWSTTDNENNNIPSIGATILSCIFGGILANIAQGWMEKDAVEKGVYELLRGKKIPEGSSHSHLRRSIKAWDYFYGIFHTIPYLAVGRNALGLLQYNAMGWPLQIHPWQILLLLSFGIADAFNSAVTFHESNLGVVNAYDNLVVSYGTPSTEQKKDKLIRMTRQLRRLFKDLQPDVLEEVDARLNQNKLNVQEVNSQEEGYGESQDQNEGDRQRKHTLDEREEI